MLSGHTGPGRLVSCWIQEPRSAVSAVPLLRQVPIFFSSAGSLIAVTDAPPQGSAFSSPLQTQNSPAACLHALISPQLGLMCRGTDFVCVCVHKRQVLIKHNAPYPQSELHRVGFPASSSVVPDRRDFPAQSQSLKILRGDGHTYTRLLPQYHVTVVSCDYAS